MHNIAQNAKIGNPVLSKFCGSFITVTYNNSRLIKTIITTYTLYEFYFKVKEERSVIGLIFSPAYAVSKYADSIDYSYLA